MPNCVLLVGARSDPHVAAVAKEIEGHGGSAAVLDRQDANDSLSVSYSDGRSAGVISSSTGERVAFEAIQAVWWRLKPVLFPHDRDAAVAAEFADSEWGHLLRSLARLIPCPQWINPLDTQTDIARKPAQLAVAQQLGFLVPKTIVSNDADAIVAFFGSEKIAYKTLSNFMFPTQEYIFTTPIDKHLLSRHRASIQRAPGIYQAYIDKSKEARATVVDDTIFWIEIDSQARDVTRIDWRRSQLERMYRLAEPDERIRALICAFMRRVGLRYAAFDFAVDQDGRIWFLECNPGGQWLWLEEATGTPITKRLAKALIGATPCTDENLRGGVSGAGT